MKKPKDGQLIAVGKLTKMDDQDGDCQVDNLDFPTLTDRLENRVKVAVTSMLGSALQQDGRDRLWLLQIQVYRLNNAIRLVVIYNLGGETAKDPKEGRVMRDLFLQTVPLQLHEVAKMGYDVTPSSPSIFWDVSNE
jgi:hypothetical protein